MANENYDFFGEILEITDSEAKWLDELLSYEFEFDGKDYEFGHREKKVFENSFGICLDFVKTDQDLGNFTYEYPNFDYDLDKKKKKISFFTGRYPCGDLRVLSSVIFRFIGLFRPEYEFSMGYSWNKFKDGNGEDLIFGGGGIKIDKNGAQISDCTSWLNRKSRRNNK